MNENNMSQLKICPKCKTVNENQAEFCRLCGEKLEVAADANMQNNEVFQQSAQQPIPQPIQPPVPPAQPVFTPVFRQNSAYNQYQQPYISELDGVPAREIELFIGDKSRMYMPKFIKKSQGKKAGLNGFLLVLGIFLSPVVQSFWFFHRKMNKIAVMVLAIGLLLLGISLPVTYNVSATMAPMQSIMTSAATDYLSANDKNVNESNIQKAIINGDYLKSISNEQRTELNRLKNELIINAALLLAINVFRLVVCVIISIFADWIYYKHTIKRIKQIKAQRVPNELNEPCNDDDIRYAGGTKTAVWAIILILYVIANIGIYFYTNSLMGVL